MDGGPSLGALFIFALLILGAQRAYTRLRDGFWRYVSRRRRRAAGISEKNEMPDLVDYKDHMWDGTDEEEIPPPTTQPALPRKPG
jgi:hypothetical protein